MKTWMVLGATVFYASFGTLVGPAFAQTGLAGGRGTLRVQAAETVPTGTFVFNSYLLTFTRGGNSSQVYNHTWTFSATYGLSDALELTTQFVPYQDDQVHAVGRPGDVQFGIKWRTPWAGRRVRTALRGFVKLPTAANHNVPFDPFSSNRVSWGFMGIASVHLPGVVPIKINLNVGYLDHNVGTILPNHSTDQLLLRLGFKIPIRAVIFYSEYSGEIFFNNSAVSFRDNSMRLTHGFKFRMPLRLVLDAGVDIGFSRDLNVYPAPLHEYADWKFFAGLSYTFFPKRYRRPKPEVQRATPAQTEKALDRLKKNRENADGILKEMLKDLERGKEKTGTEEEKK